MGKYTPLARIGNGGMADVFLAVARGPMGFNKLAVIKRLRHNEEHLHVQMFLDEARLAARLNHPNIVHTYEIGEVGGKYFIAMEYLEGQSLNALMSRVHEKGSGLSEPMIALIATRALKGLHYAHDLADFDSSPLGIVHRDVSPQNLFITYSGEIKLLDFGIAKANLNSTQTETGVLKGKVRYMAPEQVTGKPVDRRLDLFAFGVVLWEMLARRQLFQGEPLSILTRIANETAPSVTTVRPDVSPEFQAILERALRPDPAERYQTAEQMRVDVERLLKGTDAAVLEQELAKLMSDVFAETHEAVRARIQAFLADVEVRVADDAPSQPSLVRSANDLPSLLSDSGSRPRPIEAGAAGVHTGTGTGSQVNVAAPSATRAWMVAGAAVLAAVGVAGYFTLRHPVASAHPPPVAAPEPTTARLHLETSPPGAHVQWNGRPLDPTPADYTLVPGQQTLVVSLDGYETEVMSIDVRGGDSLARALALRPAAAPTPAPSASAVAVGSPTHGGGPSSHHSSSRSAPAQVAPAAPAASATSRPKIQVLDDSESQ